MGPFVSLGYGLGDASHHFIVFFLDHSHDGGAACYCMVTAILGVFAAWAQGCFLEFIPV
jgi:hypothetical protein